MHTIAEKRHNDWKKAIRKRRIAHECYGFEYYDNLHQYADNKVHCSCPLCACKTKGKKTKRTCGPAENWPIKDKKRFEDMDEQTMELEEEE